MFSSLFYSQKSSLVSGTVALLLLAGGTYALIQHSEKSNPYNKAELAREKADAKYKARAEEIARTRAEELRLKDEAVAKMQSQNAAKKEPLEADKKRAQAQKERIAKKAALAKAKALRLQIERENALADFIGTKYNELEISGRVYKDVTITQATDLGISFSYEHGARRFKYSELSEKIQQLCHYDPEVAKQAFLEQSNQRSQARSVSRNSNKKSHQVGSTEKRRKTVSKVTPRGKISVLVSSQSSSNSTRYYRGSHKYNSHVKTIEVKAKSNVPASLYQNGAMVGRVSAGVTARYTIKSDHKGKYRLELRSNSGKILATAAHNKKSGLQSSGGLN